MRKFFKAFQYAYEGIVHCLRYERNYKIHCLAMFVVIVAGIWTELSQVEWLVLIILISLMLALEMINTAMERIVDLITEEYHPLAKQAKDVAAGAVLIMAIASIIIGCIIFLPKWF